MKKAQPLVRASWLKNRLGTKNLKVFETSYGAPSAQLTEPHITGAQLLKMEDVSSEGAKYKYTVPSAEFFSAQMNRKGVSIDDHLVLYDYNENGMSFTYHVTRLWWLFKLFGHENISILEGGLRKWVDDGYPTTEEPTVFEQTSDYAAVFNDNLFINYNQIVEHEKTNCFQLIDVRNPRSFSLRSYTHAKNLPFMELYNRDGSFKEPQEIKEIFEDYGLDFSQGAPKLVSACNRGISACMIPFAAAVIGHEPTAVYDGSWVEYTDLKGST